MCLDQARLQTWEPVSVHCKGWPVRVFQKRMQRSAVPPPEANKPCWWGDQAMAFTAAKCSVYCCTGRTLEWFHTSNYRQQVGASLWCLWKNKYERVAHRQTGEILSTYLVVISTWGEQLVVCAPLEPADFLSVSLETALRLERWGSDVALQDHPIAAPRRQLVGIPCQSTWQHRMTPNGRWFTDHEWEMLLNNSVKMNEGCNLSLLQSSPQPLNSPTLAVCPSSTESFFPAAASQICT